MDVIRKHEEIEGVGVGIEAEVLNRYASGAEAVEVSLCCPTNRYDKKYLEALPAEIVEKDYGCGDPSAYAKERDVVVDLGSGSGKICYILSQIVGEAGKVIGVDFNDAMLGLARKYQGEMATKLGFGNTRFVKGRIQDLALDLDKVQRWLDEYGVGTVEELGRLEGEMERLRYEEPMIETGSVDLVVSNCVLNLVKPEEKAKLFDELYRVLRVGGRTVISDIVCDERPSEKVMGDARLWSGCISGAFLESEFLERFERAGFYGVEILERQEESWQVIDGVEFRSMTVRAFKGERGEEKLDRNQAVVYRGPWKEVMDENERRYLRGERMAVSEGEFERLTDEGGAYGDELIGLEPRVEVGREEAKLMASHGHRIRKVREMKGVGYDETVMLEGAESCGGENDGPNEKVVEAEGGGRNGCCD